MPKPMRESQLRDMVRNWLRDQPAVWVLKVHGSPYGMAGVPDFLLCVRGRFVAIELKTPRGELTAAQGYQLTEIVKAGGVVAVCRSLEDVKEVLATIAPFATLA